MEHPTKEQIREIFTKCKGGYTRILKARHKNFYTFIDTNYIGKKFGEKLYRWINSEIPNIGKCINCGKDCKFDDIFYGFRKSSVIGGFGILSDEEAVDASADRFYCTMKSSK